MLEYQQKKWYWPWKASQKMLLLHLLIIKIRHMKNSYLTCTDQFCGAGGSTIGAKAAGVDVKMAINHWELAIETHNTNHPDTDHDCRDIQATDPRRYPSTHILIASPECTNHSLAKGQKKKMQSQYQLWVEKGIDAMMERSRATMWDVPRFAEFHDYDIIIVENVVDARYWRMWDSWLSAMHALDYKHKCCYFNSMFFNPCPQSRDRMYVVFWKKGNKAPDLEFRPKAPCPKCGVKETYQSWKKPSKKWGKYKTQYVYRCSSCYDIVTPFYHSAFNVIDWSIPGQRIGDRKKPLAKNTIARIQHGLDKYKDQALVINVRHTSGVDCRVKHALTNPLPTQTSQQDSSVLMPYFLNLEHSKVKHENRIHSGLDALFTQTTSQANAFVVPYIVEMNSSGKARSVLNHISTILAGGNHHLLVGNYTPGWTKTLNEATGTITTSDHHGLFSMPCIIENRGQSKSKSCTDPISTFTSQTTHGLLTAKNLQSYLTYYYSSGHQVSNMMDAVNTITTTERASLVTPEPRIDDCFYRMLKPHEIQIGMAFDESYIILGNSRQKVKQLGNAVTPPVMEWLVGQCVKSLS